MHLSLSENSASMPMSRFASHTQPYLYLCMYVILAIDAALLEVADCVISPVKFTGSMQ